MDDQGNENPQGTPKVEPKKEIFVIELIKTIAKTIAVPVFLLLLALASTLVTCSHGISVKTTAQQIHFEIKRAAEPKRFKLIACPYLKTFSVSARNLRIITSEFDIQETNIPDLSVDTEDEALKVRSEKLTEYQIHNLETDTIPTEIYFIPHKNEGEIQFGFTERRDDGENMLTLTLPPGTTTVELGSKGKIILSIKGDSEIEYGNNRIGITDGVAREIEGKVYKIRIETQSSKQESITFYTKRGETYDIETDPNPPIPISKLRFLQTSSDTKISRHPRELLLIEKNYVPNPDINITGEIKKIEEFKITNQGITINIEGKYESLQIGESPEDKNTLLNEFMDFLNKLRN